MKNTTLLRTLFCCLSVLSFLCTDLAKVNAQINVTYAYSPGSEVYTPISGGTQLGIVTAGAVAPTFQNRILDDTIFPISAASVIPFTFQFNFINVSQIHVSTNGFLTFGTVAPAASGGGTGYAPISATTAYDGCAAVVARNLIGSNAAATLGELRYETIGTAPARKFVVQFKNFRPSNTANLLNFQIRLCETSNNIELVFGPFTGAGSNSGQVGLRGASGIFLNRKVTSGTNTWSTSQAGTASGDLCAYNSTGSFLPASGQIFRFGPPPCPAPVNLGTVNVTTSSADLTWTVTSGGGTFNVEYGLSGFTPGTGTMINNIAGTSVSIGGLTAQMNYQFYVTQNCSSSGNGFSATSGPKNFSSGGPGEDCSTATMVGVASNQGACSFTLITTGVSRNGPLAQCSDGPGNTAGNDKWVKFIAPSNGKKLVIFTSAGTVNDWVMQLWDGCPNSGGSVLPDTSGCADDDNSLMPQIILCQNQYIPGHVYYVRMWTYNSALSGNMNLCIYEDTECPIPPSNDDCLFATRLTITPPNSCPASGVTLTTKYATVSGDASACGSGSTIQDVWMVFNTGNIGDFNLNLNLGTATSLKAAIVFECNGSEVMCFNPAAGTHLITGLNPGADYILRVWSDAASWGTFTVCLSDVCQEPSASISGSTIICSGDTAHISVALAGGGPWTLTYNDGVNNHTATTSSSPYVLDTAPPATTFYSLISVSNPTCQGTVSGNYLVNVIPKPQINNFTPTSGPTGTLVTINGNNFSNVSFVGFNGVNGSGFTIVNNSQITVNVPTGSTSGLISVKNLGCTVYSSSIYSVMLPTLNVTVKAFIEGFYQGAGTMAAALDPVNKPNVCDNVQLELHGANSPYPLIMSSIAELSISGNASFSFPSSISGQSYYFVLKHRNSIETWSKVPVMIPSTGVLFNFTTHP